LLKTNATFVQSVVGVTSAASSTTALPVLLTDDEVDAILKSGNDCVGSECSVDEVSNLVSELKGQQSQMEERLKKISKMIADLEEVSNKKNRDKDEVKAFVKDMLRVFERGVSYSTNAVEMFAQSCL